MPLRQFICLRRMHLMLLKMGTLSKKHKGSPFCVQKMATQFLLLRLVHTLFQANSISPSRALIAVQNRKWRQKKSTNYLAIDSGVESRRAIAGSLNDGNLTLTERGSLYQ